MRTSGVRLLFDIMTRHGSALSGEEGRVWDMAFPLLMEVAKNAHLSDEAHRLAAGPLGAKARSVRSFFRFSLVPMGAAGKDDHHGTVVPFE